MDSSSEWKARRASSDGVRASVVRACARSRSAVVARCSATAWASANPAPNFAALSRRVEAEPSGAPRALPRAVNRRSTRRRRASDTRVDRGPRAAAAPRTPRVRRKSRRSKATSYATHPARRKQEIRSPTLRYREWGGAADYMAGKSSMTSFAMSCRCSKTSSVPCHMVVS